MSRRRVLHVYKYFRPRFTGEGIFLERLAPIFARLRPDVSHEVLVTATPRPEVTPVLPGLAKVHYLAHGDRGASQRELISWLGLNARRYSVVHHHTHVDRTFLGNILLKLQGCRLLLSATLDDSVAGLLGGYRPLWRPVARRLFGVIDKFIAISPKLLRETARFIPDRRCALTPMGIPLPEQGVDARSARREALCIPGDAFVLVSVGGICQRKDQMFLVQQLPQIIRTQPNLLLVLVGPVLDAAYQAEIEALVASNALGRHVRFAGYSERPADFYEAADLMVFASREEGFGTAMIEAMAHGLPLVARRLPGVNDGFVSHGRNGYLFDTPEEFHAYVGGLVCDHALRRRIGEQARADAAANFDIAVVAARYLALYGYPAGGAV